ncbi:MAG TPA: cellulose-binding domain-containing protein, partial [Cellvibrio sp.]|nr:cellulose-binding domain-containing protein [Cellvibrio sp.]
MHKLTMFPDQITRALKRIRGMVTVGAVLAITAQGASAACTYNIDNEWNTGFVASITIKNDTGAAVNGWSINWSYSTNRITSSWNTNLTGSNPYTATNIGWNGSIAAGQSVSFGFQGNKNGATAERPTINGTVCAGGTASSVRS